MEVTKTVDMSTSLTCMGVALNDVQVAACRAAIRPVELHLAKTVDLACDTMTIVRPLLVLVDDGVEREPLRRLRDQASVCGAEVVVVDPSPQAAALTPRVLAALRIAESRRVAR